LVPVLLFLYPDEAPQTLTAVSLFVVAINASSGTLGYAIQRRIDYRSGLAFVIATFPGAVAGAVLVGYMPRRLFDAVFALVLISLGAALFVRSGNTAIIPPVTGRGVVRRLLRDRAGNTFVYSFQMWKGILLSIGIGFLSTLLGIGGGIIHVPMMMSVLHFPVHIATATSQFVLVFVAAEGSAVHFARGVMGWNEWLLRAVLLSIGAVPGAQIGALLARRLQSSTIVRALSAALVVVGARLALQALNL
jgi:uncharacterized protein